LGIAGLLLLGIIVDLTVTASPTGAVVRAQTRPATTTSSDAGAGDKDEEKGQNYEREN